MMIYKDKIHTTELHIGMYVCKLDRPWLDTPFPFQGFFIRSKLEIKELRKFCKYVFVDAEKGHSPYRESEISKPSPLLVKEKKKRKPVTAANNYRYTHVKIGLYAKNKTPYKKETSTASNLLEDLSFSMDQVNFNIRTGIKLNLSETKKITRNIVNSIIRNPDSLVSLCRLKDKGEYTYNHSLRCCILSAAFGRYLGLNRKDLMTLATGALFADIGKSRLKTDLLNLKGKLSIEDKLKLNSHVELGVEILVKNNTFEHEVLVITETHHERYNGSGYPYALVGEEIPYLGQIVGMVDVFDAITNKKSYGQHMDSAQAMDWLYNQRGVLFSEQLVEDFIQAIGLYPAGTKVELTDSSKAIVLSQNPDKRLRPVVYLIRDCKDRQLKKFKKIDLSKKSLFSNKERPMIAKAIV
jgi:putative nucleotidyltransferase with HDIG domain